MIPAQNVKTVLCGPYMNTNSSVYEMVIDRSGFDYCVFDVFYGTGDTATVCLQSISVYESDTVTVASSMTRITALSGSQATSTTYGFAIPVPTGTADGGIVTLQMDLKGRKKYIGLYILASSSGATAVIGAIGRLSRGEKSPITAADHDGVNAFDTNQSGCVKLVSA